jgi:hypothetical protein
VAAVITLLLFAAQPLTQAMGVALLGPLDYRAIYGLVAVSALLLLTVTRGLAGHVVLGSPSASGAPPVG